MDVAAADQDGLPDIGVGTAQRGQVFQVGGEGPAGGHIGDKGRRQVGVADDARPYRLAHDVEAGRADHRIGHIGVDRRFFTGFAVGVDIVAHRDLGTGRGGDKAVSRLVGGYLHRRGADNLDRLEVPVLVIMAGAEVGQVNLGPRLGGVKAHLYLDGRHLAVGQERFQAVMDRWVGCGLCCPGDKKPRPYRCVISHPPLPTTG